MDTKHYVFLVMTLAATVFTILLSIWTGILWSRLNSDLVRVNNLIIKNDFITTSATAPRKTQRKLAAVTSTSLYAQEAVGRRINANQSDFTSALAQSFVFDEIVNQNAYYIENLVATNLTATQKGTFDRVQQSGQILTFSPYQLSCAKITAPESTIASLNAGNITATTATVVSKATSRDVVADAVVATNLYSASLSSKQVNTTSPFVSLQGSSVQVKKISTTSNVTFSNTARIDKLNRITSNGSVTINSAFLNITGEVSVKNKIVVGEATATNFKASTLNSGNYTSTQNFSFNEITTQNLVCGNVISNKNSFSYNINVSTFRSDLTRIGSQNIIDRTQTTFNRVVMDGTSIYDGTIEGANLQLSAVSHSLGAVSNAGTASFASANFLKLTGQGSTTAQNLTAGLVTQSFNTTLLNVGRWNISGSFSATQYNDSTGKAAISQSNGSALIDCQETQASYVKFRSATGLNEQLCKTT